MANVYGNNIKLEIYGGSHDADIGVRLSGFPAGMPVDEAQLLRIIPGEGSFVLFSADDSIRNLCAAILAEVSIVSL